MMELDNRHVVVSGGTGALGTAVVAALLARGAHVHVPVETPRPPERFPYLAHDRVSVRAGQDFTDEETVRSYYAELPGCWASVHVAGGFRMAPFTETSLEDFMALMGQNAVTCFLASREAVRKMRGASAGGRIVNVTAKPALVPSPGLVAYAASKAAVATLTTALAEEVAADGIWVNAIAPSIIDTPRNRAAMPDADHDSWPRPEELAATILHLVSPSNAATRGAILPVYGRA